MHRSVTSTTHRHRDQCPAGALASSCKSTQRQLTIMLVTICCAAVCLQLPYTILYLINANKDELWPDQKQLHATIYTFR